MELLVPITLYGWLPIVLVMFRDLRGHRAIVVAYVTAWLFLPSTGIPFAGLPDYTKVTATTLGTMLAVVVWDPRRLLRFRPIAVDLFMIGFCFCPLLSAIANNLGLWDGASNSLNTILAWGLPYVFGRMYFDSFDKLRDLAKGIFVGGLIYVPFCLIEVRMSPQLYSWIYGPRLNTLTAYRYGGWRPVVFLSTGLELGMWMTAAALMGFALWYSGAVRRILGIKIGIPLFVVIATAVLCKSTGALLLLFGGITVLVAARRMGNPVPLLCVLLVPLVYVPVRTAHLNDGTTLVRIASSVFGEDRAQSLAFRFQNEALLVERALEAPWFGWGGWGREKVRNEYGEDQTIVDGLWIITLGKHGFVGLVSLLGAFLVTPAVAGFRFAKPSWRYADIAPTLAITLLLMLYMIDCLLNAMVNPIYSLCLGALAGVAYQPFRRLVGEFDDEEQAASARAVVRGRLWPPVRSRLASGESSTESGSERLVDTQIVEVGKSATGRHESQ